MKIRKGADGVEGIIARPAPRCPVGAASPIGALAVGDRGAPARRGHGKSGGFGHEQLDHGVAFDRVVGELTVA
eukprot:6945822-Lingulodinium_polyedra.AAC.1